MKLIQRITDSKTLAAIRTLADFATDERVLAGLKAAGVMSNPEVAAAVVAVKVLQARREASDDTAVKDLAARIVTMLDEKKALRYNALSSHLSYDKLLGLIRGDIEKVIKETL